MSAWRLWPPGGAAVGRCGLPSGARDIRSDDVGGVPIQAASGPVIPDRGPRISMRGSFLDVAQWHPRIKPAVMNACLSVWGVTVLAIPARRATLRTIHPAPCRSSRRPSAARKTGPSHRSPVARSIARAVRGASGMVTTLPPLRVIVRVRCPRSRPRCSISAPGRLRHSQPVQGEQGNQRVLQRRAKAGGDQHGAEFVAVQGGGMRLVVQPRAADVRGRGMIQEFFFDGVPVEPGDGAQPPGDGGAGARPLASRSRAKPSISARRTANRGRERARHQVVKRCLSWRVLAG